MNIDTVIEAYVKTRNKIKELKDQIKELEEYQDKKEQWFLKEMQESGTTSMKSPHGTVYTSTFESATVADREVFMNWVIENDKYEFLENRVSKAEVLNMMGDVEDGSRPNNPPPGVNYTAIKKVGVRKG